MALLCGGVLIVALALRILLRLSRTVGADHAHDSRDHHAHTHVHHRHDQAAHAHSHDQLDEDAHAAAHAAELRKTLARGAITNAEVAWFGFTGGLLPCPAAFAVLLACLHQKAYVLGLIMVAAFSVGLALMLVAIGIGVAWGANALQSRVTSFSRVTRWAPYVSAIIVLAIGCVVIVQGTRALALL